MVKKSAFRLAKDYVEHRKTDEEKSSDQVRTVKNPLKLLNPYNLCPCGEGKRFRFCCQSLVPPYIEKRELPEWIDLFERAKEVKASW